jgi:hypothetical protein
VVVSWIGDAMFQLVGEGVVELLGRIRLGRKAIKPLTAERGKLLARRSKERSNRRLARQAR